MMKKLFTILAGWLLLGGECLAQTQGVSVRAMSGTGTNLTARATGTTAALTVIPQQFGDGIDVVAAAGTADSLALFTVNGVTKFLVDYTGTGYFDNGAAVNVASDFQWLAQSHIASSAVGKINLSGFSGSNPTNLTSLTLGAEDSSHPALFATNLSPPTVNVKTGTGANDASLVASNITANGTGGFIGVGTSLTALNGANISSGTIAAARLGSGSGASTVFLNGAGAFSAPGGAAGTHPLGNIYISTNTWGVSNSTTRISMFGTNNGVGTLTLASTDMNVGTVIHLEFWGPYQQPTGDGLGIAFYLGGTQIYTNTWITGVNGNALMHISSDITFRAVGASGSVIIDGVRDIPALINSSTIGVATTVDTTASRALEATIVWGTAQAGNNFTIDQAIVRYNP